jgi:hypothetical protein
MDPITINSRNEKFGQFQAARNNLLEQLQTAAANLKPGEETLVTLEIQLRRVNDAPAAPATDATNPFVKSVIPAAG